MSGMPAGLKKESKNQKPSDRPGQSPLPVFGPECGLRPTSVDLNLDSSGKDVVGTTSRVEMDGMAGWMNDMGWQDGLEGVGLRLWHRAGILPSVMREPSAASALSCSTNLFDFWNTSVPTATEQS